jgi:tetratricopeptide (TPR) repeat protein
MATIEWTRPVSAPAAAGSVRRPEMALGGALLALCFYAVFAQGAIGTPAGPRLEVAVAVVALLTATGVLSGRLRVPGPPLGRRSLLLMAAFAAWCGLSVLWSASPDRSWLEFNRVASYGLVAVLAATFGASAQRATERVREGLQLLGTLVVLYAIGQKVLPGLHLLGIVDLNQTGRYARLQEPIGYWNALALLLALTAPAVLTGALRVTATRRRRTLSLLTLQLMIVAVGFTESRGGVLAFSVVLLLTVAASGDALRHAAWAALAVLGGVAPLAVGLSAHALSGDGVPLAHRESAGLLLAIVLVAALTLVAVTAARGYELELQVSLTETQRTRWLRRLALALAAVLLLVAGVYLAAGGLRGFASPQQASVSAPGRLFSTDSADRLEWWRQALGGWRDRPLTGWGAGAFPVVNLLYRRDTLSALDAHSVPLQWLVETGLIGALLAALAWAFLLRDGLASLRAEAPDRAARLALFAAGIAYTVHALYDWDWQIPGVTLPALVALGALAAARPVPAGKPAPATGAVGLARLAVLTFGLCVYGASAALPGIAGAHASRAAIEAAAGRLRAAQHDANLATRLDPLSDVGPLASEAIALQLRDLPAARSDLLEAASREPDDLAVWRSLLTVDLDLGRFRQAIAAAQRVVVLDPAMPGGQALSAVLAACGAELGLAPPAGSATAQP